MKNIYAVTHTESLHHVQNIGGGWFDSPLTERGRRQASQAADYLASAIQTEEVRFYTSDLLRASETCEIIAAKLHQGITKCRELREMCYGEAEGQPDSWIRENIQPTPAIGNRLDHRIFPQAESRREVAIRIRTILDQIVQDPAQNIIVVTHGFALTFFVMAWLKVPVDNLDYVNFRATPGGITFLQEDDYFRNRNVIYLNKTEHIRQEEPR